MTEVKSGPGFQQADLATALDNWLPTPGTTKIRVAFYDLEGTKPVYPAGDYTRNPAAGPFSYGAPREVALCLSFYGSHNAPRHRGRLYIPAFFASSATLGLRPSGTHISKVMALGPIFSALGGVNIDWIVWSRANRAATKVENYWVDDEWDMMRSRGQKRTTRSMATTSG